MLKQTITVTDFNGNERTEDLYFNLTEAELVDIQNASDRGIQEDLKEAIAAKDLRKMLDFIKMLVVRSYGEKSSDGKHFRKSDQIREDFINSAFYSDLLLHLFEDEGTRAEKFITGLMPKDLVERAAAKTRGEAPAGYKPDARELSARHMAEKNIPAPQFQGNFEEAAPIGGSTQVQFQAPVPPHPSYTERATAAGVIQPEPSVQDSPPVAAPSTQPPAAEEPHKPFRIKETPINDGPVFASEQERLNFEAWKAQNPSE